MNFMDKVTAFKRYGSELLEAAEFFRSIAWIINDNPDSIMNYASHPIITRLVSDNSSTCSDRIKILEALAYGDAGVMLSAPGPSLSGILIRELGSPQQQELFFEYVRNKKARTFFAVTEPGKGSDANNMQSELVRHPHEKNQYFLNAEKWLVGNGACGSIGTLMARTSSSPLGLTAILLLPEDLKQSTLYRTRLVTAGMSGVQLSYLSFNKFNVNQSQFLGLHLGGLNRGLLAMVKTFNRMRPCVGALAIGLSQAILDYVITERRNFNKTEQIAIERLKTTIEINRQLLQKAAIAVDSKPLESTSLISIAKLQATHAAEKIAAKSFTFFGQAAYFEHPWLAKWYRDSFAFEYMEGTTDMQRKNIFKEVSSIGSVEKLTKEIL